MKVSAIKCLGCGDIIYSRARHDWHRCSCGKTFIDGGFDYMRVGWDEETGYEHADIELEGVTEEDLYDDWNKKIDKYGTIKEKKDD